MKLKETKMSEKTQEFEKFFNAEKDKWTKAHLTAAYALEDEIRKWMYNLPVKTDSVWENARLHLMNKAEKRNEYINETIRIAFMQDTVPNVIHILR